MVDSAYGLDRDFTIIWTADPVFRSRWWHHHKMPVECNKVTVSGIKVALLRN